jgi:uncharacterized membrane protein YfcA
MTDRFKKISIGLLTGIFSGFFGIGGATILIPALDLFYKVDQKAAQGTSLLIIPFLALASMFNYFQAGNLDLAYAFWLGAGAMSGIFFGSFLAIKTPSAVLTKIFGIFLMLVSLRLFFY